MERFAILLTIIEYIEANLTEDITQEDIAKECSYSLSSIQKMFSKVFHIGVADYINRRKITAASKDLLETDDTILDIAIRYGYNSHEVFSRAFVRVWGESPSKYRKNRSFSEIYPKLDMPVMYDDIPELGYKKKFDYTNLYEALKSMHGTYALSLDVVALLTLNNEYGHSAGDLAIAEAVKRISAEKTNDMLMCRVGGDEFILLTNKKTEAEAKKILDRIFSHNGEKVIHGGIEHPISLHGGIMKLDTENVLKYDQLYTDLIETVRQY